MSAKPMLRSDVEIRELDEHETLLYDPQSDTIHVLNSTAALIATLCDGEHAAEQMVDKIHARFQVEDDVDVLSDVEEVLATFKIQGLLQY